MTQLSQPVTDRDHAQGSANAPVTLLEYGDYECPHCGRAHNTIQAIEKRMGNGLRFVFRNFPLTTIHPDAKHAAEAAEAAGAQGKFWQMNNMLFEHQDHLNERSLAQYAAEIGLDTGKFEQDMASHAYAARVREDFLSGIRSGVNGTPSFFINGQRYDGPWDFDDLLAALGNTA